MLAYKWEVWGRQKVVWARAGRMVGMCVQAGGEEGSQGRKGKAQGRWDRRPNGAYPPLSVRTRASVFPQSHLSFLPPDLLPHPSAEVFCLPGWQLGSCPCPRNVHTFPPLFSLLFSSRNVRSCWNGMEWNKER